MAKFKWYCNECDSTLLFEAWVDEDMNITTELDSCICSNERFDKGKKRKSCPNHDKVVHTLITLQHGRQSNELSYKT